MEFYNLQWLFNNVTNGVHYTNVQRRNQVKMSDPCISLISPGDHSDWDLTWHRGQLRYAVFICYYLASNVVECLLEHFNVAVIHEK